MTSARLLYLDNLKAVLIALIIALHAVLGGGGPADARLARPQGRTAVRGGPPAPAGSTPDRCGSSGC
jgi:hypothetical protein